MRHRLLLAGALLASLPPPALGAGANHGGHTIYQSPRLWATVDLCNTAKFPHTIGIRGSMPGSGIAAEHMYMRFRVEYQISSTAPWTYISGADSGFIAVGSAVYKARQAGRSFVVAPAQPGKSFVLRGVVTFEWRRRGHVVRHAQKATTAGHSTTSGSDPPGYSAASCTLT
jgi:hypothetical protein